jgi:hypothetical protein
MGSQRPSDGPTQLISAPNWELKETENKTRFVEFTGKAKESSKLLPDGTKVVVQFTLMQDNTFELSYAGFFSPDKRTTTRRTGEISECRQPISRGSDNGVRGVLANGIDESRLC